MRLLNDATSPFGRKVMVAAIERGLPVREEFVNVTEPGKLDEFNPLRQIPTLVTDNGYAIYDSSVILGYLDTLHAGERLVPTDPTHRVPARIALADGLMEATLQRITELRRPAEQQSAATVARLEGRISRALTELDRIRPELQIEPLRADAIAVACALDYVDFRYSRRWRDELPSLSAWQHAIAARPSMRLTAPTRNDPVPSPV